VGALNAVMTDARIETISMPKWGLSMTSGRITEWLVSEGDDIQVGTELAEIDTDKIEGVLESPAAGILRRIIAGTGSSAPVGATIAVVAPADVPDADVDEVVAEAEEQLARGEIEEPPGPVVTTVEVEGRRLCYATMGDGEEVAVLVHGYGGDKNSWLFVQEPLARTRTVHAIDLPGHGASDKDVGDGSLDILARTVTGFLDATGIERAHLVGHSLGGAVVAAVAAAAPERVSALTLVAPAGFGRVDAGYLRGFAAAGSRRELRPLLGRLFADEGQVTRQLVDDLLKYKRLDGVAAALETLVGTLLDGDEQAIDGASLLARVKVPVTVVWGRADRILAPVDATALGQAELRLIEGAGHMAHMEKPQEVVAAVQVAR
jgi:pyruvate dehydrogenase E2 component (dihydrolipoamide acetyltransferase)